VWLLVVVLGLGAFAFGAWCFSEQVRRGFIVTNLRNLGYGGAPWGLYISFDVYFVGVSFAGITVSALARLFHIEALKPATRVAEFLTITALLAGACVILADLGRPLDGLIKLPRFARPQSPFYGTFTLVVAGYLFSSMVFFFLSARPDAALMARRGPAPLRWLYRLWATGYRGCGAEMRRHRTTSFWLSVTILPLLVTAHSTLGFIFGTQAGRPGWFGALQAPAFVVLAGVSGTGMVIIALASVRRMFRLDEEIPDKTLRWLTNFMATLALVYVYFMVVDELTASYAAPTAERSVAHSVVTGHFAPLFWITIVCLLLTFLIPFGLRLRKMTSVPAMVLVAVLANVAAVCKRYLIVVPSLTHGALVPIEHGDYTPGYIELGIIVGLFGLLAAALFLFARIFPLTPTPAVLDDPKEGADRPMRAWLRTVVTLAVAGAGLTMIAIGLVDSFRLLSHGELDPTIPYSPMLFAAGVMLLFCSAIAYEVVPASKRDDLEDDL